MPGPPSPWFPSDLAPVVVLPGGGRTRGTAIPYPYIISRAPTPVPFIFCSLTYSVPEILQRHTQLAIAPHRHRAPSVVCEQVPCVALPRAERLEPSFLLRFCLPLFSRLLPTTTLAHHTHTHTHIHTHEPVQHSTQRTPIPPATGAHSGRQRHTRHPSSPLNTPITLRRIHSELDWKPNWISRRLSTSNLRSLDPGDHPLGSSSIQDPTLFHDVCVTGPRQFLDRISAPFRRPSRGQAW